MNVERLQARARAVRARAVVRAWEFRQRTLAAGVWGRLVRLFALAQAVYEIPCGTAQELIAAGAVPAAVGYELDPPRTILILDGATASSLPGARELPLRPAPFLLGSPCLAVVLFDGVPPP